MPPGGECFTSSFAAVWNKLSLELEGWRCKSGWEMSPSLISASSTSIIKFYCGNVGLIFYSYSILIIWLLKASLERRIFSAKVPSVGTAFCICLNSSVYTWSTTTKESGTYLLHIVYLYGVWRLDVALLDQQLGVSVLFLLLLRLLGAQLPFYLLFFDVRILNERLLKVIFNCQMWGVPWVRSVLTSITLEGIFWRRQIVATALIG